MASYKTDFFIQTAFLDKYIHKNPSDHPIISQTIIQQLIESDDLLNYFFSQSPSYLWADLLLEKHMFDEPPNVIVIDNTYKIPYWPQSKYLQDIAYERPNVVLKVIEKIKTNNPSIHYDLIESLLKIPPDSSTKYLPIIINWLSNKYIPPWRSTPEAISHLMIWYFQNTKQIEGFILLDQLIQPNANKTQETNSYFGKNAKPRFDFSYLRPDFWKVTIPSIEQYANLSLIAVLLKNFLITLELEMPTNEYEKTIKNKMSSIWRSAIGDTVQDRYPDYKDTLLISLRNSLSRYIENNLLAGEIIITWLINQELTIFNRLGFYLATNHAIHFPNIIEYLLLDLENLHSTDLHHEYFELLKNGFPIINEEIKKKVLSLILIGPSNDILNQIFAPDSSNTNANQLDRKNDYIDNWIFDRLWMIKDYLQPEEYSLFNQLLQKFGEPTNPEFLSYVSEAYFVQDESPITIEQILIYEPTELIAYITSWNPERKSVIPPIEISHSGFANAFSLAFCRNPEHFQSVLTEIANLPSKYISAIFSEAKKCLQTDENIPWKELLTIIINIAKIDEYGNYSALKNRHERKEILWFLNDAITNNKYPLEYTSALKSILTSFLTDPDPDSESDNPPEGYLGHNDPISIALNSVRPLSLDTLFAITNLEERKFKEEKDLNKIGKPFDEIRPILINMLDRKKETSWAVHTIFGKWIDLINFCDPIWLKEQITTIFPDSKKDEIFFISAWLSFIEYNNPNREMFLLLRQQYFTAINLFSSGNILSSHNTGTNHLANHLLLDYLWQPYDFQSSNGDTFLGQYFQLCNQDQKGSCIWTLWKMVERTKDELKKDIWPEVLKFWRWRSNEFILSGYSNEFFQEIQWFTYLLLVGPITSSFKDYNFFLDSILVFVEKDIIWKNLEIFLSLQVDDFPKQVIYYYSLMHEKAKTPEYGVRFYNEYSDKIVYSAIEHKDCRDDTKSLIDFIGRKDQRYRNLYEKYTK